MTQEYEDSLVWDSNGTSFRLKIDADMRRAGIGQVRCYEEYLDIEFIGGYDVRITYPSNMNNLREEIEYKLRLETSLPNKNIQYSIFYLRI